MHTKLMVARWFRVVARILSVLVILLAAAYLLFVGLMVALEGGGSPTGLLVYMLPLAVLVVGLILAFFSEPWGAAIALLAVAGYLVLSLVVPGVREMGGGSILVGPLNLFNAMVAGKGTDPDNVSIGTRVVSWLLTAPIWLFGASWWLRRPGVAAPQAPTQDAV